MKKHDTMERVHNKTLNIIGLLNQSFGLVKLEARHYCMRCTDEKQGDFYGQTL